jgi:hypothetical protein
MKKKEKSRGYVRLRRRQLTGSLKLISCVQSVLMSSMKETTVHPSLKGFARQLRLNWNSTKQDKNSSLLKVAF